MALVGFFSSGLGGDEPTYDETPPPPDPPPPPSPDPEVAVDRPETPKSDFSSTGDDKYQVEEFVGDFGSWVYDAPDAHGEASPDNGVPSTESPNNGVDNGAESDGWSDTDSELGEWVDLADHEA